jgi:hypothetical protein
VGRSVACHLVPTQKGVSDHLFWSKVKCSTPTRPSNS